MLNILYIVQTKIFSEICLENILSKFMACHFTFIAVSFLSFIEVQLIYNAVLVPGVQQSHSVIYIYVYIYLFLFQILCPYRLSSTVLYSKSLLVIDFIYVCVYAQSCQTLFDPMDCSLPGSSVHGIYQTRILEQVAIFFSRGNLPDSGIKPTSLMFPALAGRFFTTSATGKHKYTTQIQVSQVALVVKNPAASAGDVFLTRSLYLVISNSQCIP